MQPGLRAGIVPVPPHPGRRVREETLTRRTAEAACLRPCTALPFPRCRSFRQCDNENRSFREGDLRSPFGAHLRFYFDSSQRLWTRLWTNSLIIHLSLFASRHVNEEAEWFSVSSSAFT